MFTIISNNKDEVKQALHDAVIKALTDVGDQAVDYVSDLSPVDTGKLAGSYTKEVEGDEAVVIGTNTEYAPYVELGHNTVSGGYVAPRPHLKPGIMNHIDEYKSIIEEDLRNA